MFRCLSFILILPVFIISLHAQDFEREEKAAKKKFDALMELNKETGIEAGNMQNFAPGYFDNQYQVEQQAVMEDERNPASSSVKQDPASVEVTLSRFSQTLTWKERFHFLIDILKGFFFRKQQMKKIGNFDLSKVPPKQLVKKLIKELKQRYPNIYKVLVEERNKVMIRNLKYLFKENPDKKILAIVGAGHEDAIKRAFKSKSI